MMKKILVSFVTILVLIFISKFYSVSKEEYVYLSGKIAKVECDIKEETVDNYVSTKGTGIITFIDPISNNYGAVGHSISSKGNEVKGNIYYSKLSEIEKSVEGTVGKLSSNIEDDKCIGTVDENNDFGIYGKNLINPKEDTLIEVANKKSIKTGDAIVYIDFGDDSKKEYKIKIEEVYYDAVNTNSCFRIEIVDEELIEKTGGIVRGMSGSPIIQDGKLIGALTKASANDAKFGYGIFAEVMIEECRN